MIFLFLETFRNEMINRQYGYPETSRNRPKFVKRKSRFQYLCIGASMFEHAFQQICTIIYYQFLPQIDGWLPTYLDSKIKFISNCRRKGTHFHDPHSGGGRVGRPKLERRIIKNQTAEYSYIRTHQ